MCTKRLVPESHSTFVHDSKNICKQLLVRKLTLVQRGQGETNERGRPLQISLRNFDKQGNCLLPLFTRLLLSGQKTHRSSYAPARTLKVHTETLPGFRQYSVQMGSTTCCSRKAASFIMAPTMGTVGRMHIPRAGQEKKNL